VNLPNNGLIQEIIATNFLWNSPFLNLKNIQNSRLNILVGNSRRSSIFYKKKFSHLPKGNVSLEEIPISTKSELMHHFDSWLTNKSLGIYEIKKYIANISNIGKPLLNKYLIMESSGSSGIPGIFLHDLKAVKIYHALESSRRANSSLLNQLFGYLYFKEKVVYIGALNGHYAGIASIYYSKTCYPELKSMIKEISIYNSKNKVAHSLNSFQPTVITTYPSVAIALAEDKIKGNLKFNPREIWVGGETLGLRQKKFIQSAFNARIFNSYGSSEFPPIAWECDFGKLHVNSDWVILEAVDETYKKVPDGTFSHTSLLTNLCNFIQPTIRYELGDQICFDPFPCACGNHLPTIRIMGRSSECLYFNNVLGEKLSIPMIELTTLIEESGFLNFYITQDSKSNLEVFFKNPQNIKYSDQVIKTLREHLIKKKISSIEIKVNTIPRSSNKKGSGKLRMA
jgi:phenylacetate-CoA ligase